MLTTRLAVDSHKGFKAFSLLFSALVLSIMFIGSCSCAGKGGNKPSENADKNNLAANDCIVATFTPESKNAFSYNSPTIVGDYLYIGTSTKMVSDKNPTGDLASLPSNFFYKMDLNLKPVWKYTLGASMCDGAASLDSMGNIYFVIMDFSVNPDPNSKGYFALMSLCSLTSSGEFRWKKQISAQGENWIHGMLNCAIGADDTIYVADSKLFAFKQDGTILWQYPQDDSRPIVNMRGSPVIDAAGDVYFVSPEPTNSQYGSDVIRAYKFKGAGDGTPVWSVTLGNNVLLPEGGATYGGGRPENWMYSSPAFSSGYKSLYAAVGNTISRIDTETGKLLWSFMPEGVTGSFKASPVVDGNDNVYIGSKSNADGTMFAIKADGSGLLWKKLIGADLYPTPLLADDGLLYFGSETIASGHFHAVDVKTGATVWGTGVGYYPMGDISFCSPALYKGFIYVGGHQVAGGGDKLPEALFKIKVGAGGYMLNAAWPRFLGGNATNGRIGG